MNFKKLNIYGFKSFADKVEVEFEPGITAIVGPNGCGKSNVAESIRFVMGESSAKALRGGAMTDVIFNGTEKRKPLSYCEVSLTFDNSNKVFSLDTDEVVLTRKLYRSGENEYLINNNNCRRKDIINAFREVGLGKESYSVIGQGKIDSLLSAKPEDRRKVFEEASGISKFKEEKAASETKLLNVNDNLTRINDILSELERQIGPLKNQAENAKIFLELSNKLKDLEINIYVYQYDHSNTEKQKIYDTIAGIDEELALRQSEFDKAVKEYEISQKQMTELDDQINNLRDELLNLMVVLEKQNGEIKLYNEKISILKEQNEKMLGDVEHGNFVLENNKVRVTELRNSIETARQEIAQSEKQQQSLENEYKLTLDKLSLGEANAVNFDSELYSTLEKSGDIKSNLYRYQTELSSLQERQAELTSEKKELEDAYNSYQDRINLSNSQIQVIEEKIELKIKEKTQIYSKINEFNEKFNEISEKIEQKKVEYHSSLSRYNLLKDMKEYNEGYALSVKRLLEQAQNGSSIGGKVVGVVASLMNVPAKYEVAIEMALGASVQNIVTKNEEDAKALVEYLKVNKFGRVTFLPIASVKERYIPSSVEAKMNMKGVLGVASELIEYDKAYSSVFSSLLGSTVIIDNMDNAVDFARATGYMVRLVTLDGDIISPQGSITGGSRKETGANLIGRDREINELAKKLEELKSAIDELNKKAEALRNEGSKQSDRASALVEEVHNLEMEKAKHEELISSLEGQLDEARRGLSECEVNFDAILDKIEFASTQIDQISKEQENVNTQKSKATESKKQANDTFGKLRQERDRIFEQLGELKVELEAKRNALTNLESEVERVEVSNAENEYRTKETMLQVQKNNAEIESYQKKIENIMAGSEFSASSKQVDAVKAKIDSTTESKKMYQEQMNVADGNKMLLAGEIQKAHDKKAKEENQLVKIDVELENMQNQVWEEYQMTYGDAKKLALPDFDIKAGTEECSNIKKQIQKLGNVNLAAIEDIKEVSARYDDLSSQRDDLTKAQNDLIQIIKELTSQMEEKFTSCFEQIRQNFQVTFKELFGGGKADILLDDMNNVLECGIDIIAEPPGKKLLNITLLSGGERAFTAIAILFSILKLRPMPFCVLDEIEAALDDSNISRYATYLHRFSQETQFIVITHRKPTMELADALYGVTMEEKGVSKVVSVKLSDAIKYDQVE